MMKSFSHRSLLTDTQVLSIHIAFANGSSANIKFSKTQLFKMIQLGGFFTSDPLDVFGPLSLFKIIYSKGNSYEKLKRNFINYCFRSNKNFIERNY